MLLRNYKFRIYPSKAQRQTIEHHLELCRQLYNAALEQRITAWRSRRKSVSRYDQNNELPRLKQEIPEFCAPYSQALLSPLDRLNKAFQNFFRRMKLRQKPGFPRFKARHRFNSFEYPQHGFKIDEGAKKIELSKIGSVKIKQWRSLPSPARNCKVLREPDGWYVVLCCSIEPILLPPTNKIVGIDVGLTSLVACSDTQVLGDLTGRKQDARKLRRTQSRLLRRKKHGSGRRVKARCLFAKTSRRLARKWEHELHHISKKLVAENDVIGLEDLKIQQMVAKKGTKKKSVSTPAQKTGLRRNIHLAAWGKLREQIVYKAEEAGRRVVLVDPRGTTQDCSGCGTTVPKTLRDRTHSCPNCGLVLNRDLNAAINILQRARQALRGGPGSPSDVRVNETRRRLKEFRIAAQQ